MPSVVGRRGGAREHRRGRGRSAPSSSGRSSWPACRCTTAGARGVHGGAGPAAGRSPAPPPTGGQGSQRAGGSALRSRATVPPARPPRAPGSRSPARPRPACRWRPSGRWNRRGRRRDRARPGRTRQRCAQAGPAGGSAGGPASAPVSGQGHRLQGRGGRRTIAAADRRGEREARRPPSLPLRGAAGAEWRRRGRPAGLRAGRVSRPSPAARPRRGVARRRGDRFAGHGGGCAGAAVPAVPAEVGSAAVWTAGVPLSGRAPACGASGPSPEGMRTPGSDRRDERSGPVTGSERGRGRGQAPR